MARFIIKNAQDFKPSIPIVFVKARKTEENNEINIKDVMTTEEKIAMAQAVLEGQPKVKRVKKDKGLIERTESSKTILTEDNKELLND